MVTETIEPKQSAAKLVVRWLMALAMIAIGVDHFLQPEPFVAIVPAFLPAKAALVYISGVAEVAGGLGLLISRTRKWASWGLVALYVAVFPANINMAINEIQLGSSTIPVWAMWLRLPFQLLFIVGALWVGRDDHGTKSHSTAA